MERAFQTISANFTGIDRIAHGDSDYYEIFRFEESSQNGEGKKDSSTVIDEGKIKRKRRQHVDDEPAPKKDRISRPYLGNDLGHEPLIYYVPTNGAANENFRLTCLNKRKKARHLGLYWGFKALDKWSNPIPPPPPQSLILFGAGYPVCVKYVGVVQESYCRKNWPEGKLDKWKRYHKVWNTSTGEKYSTIVLFSDVVEIPSAHIVTRAQLSGWLQPYDFIHFPSPCYSCCVPRDKWMFVYRHFARLIDLEGKSPRWK